MQFTEKTDSSLVGAHTLYVEGNSGESFDPTVMRELLPRRVMVKPLKASSNIRSAAQVLRQEHPNYYFLVDRDFHDDETVEKSWNHFPDPKYDNLLIWRKKELENYFLDPDYLAQSEFLRPGKDLRDCILKHARKRVYLDVVNSVIVNCREAMKANWIKLSKNSDSICSKDDALGFLLEREAFTSQNEKCARLTGKHWLQDEFERLYSETTGGSVPIKFGTGNWLDMMSGKPLLKSVVHECFRVKDNAGNQLHGRIASEEVVKGLLRMELEKQPDDFQQLHQLVIKRVEMS